MAFSGGVTKPDARSGVQS